MSRAIFSRLLKINIYIHDQSRPALYNYRPLLGCSRSRVSGAALAFQSQPHTPHRMSHLLKTTMFAPPIACLLNVTSGF
ncbi:hypothetical protein RRG08_062397 [Elysia crispata]|uniref:Uncharacterized protein n=1 Tax=Elysia crispata TaxID=231223 RepID=A0AAE1AUG7_9GAST|nr:hypothetical protein RRG08_062397 [Elysia crispata]